MQAIRGRGTGIISARRDGPRITDERPDLAPTTMGTVADRWTTPGGANLMEQQHDLAGEPRLGGPATQQVDIGSVGTIRSGGYEQGVNANPNEQDRIDEATARLAAREARLGEAGSEERVAAAQEGLVSYPAWGADIRDRRREAARVDPAGQAADRAARRSEASTERRAIVAARRGGSAVISARRDAARPGKRRHDESKPAYQKRMQEENRAPLTFEQQREQRLLDRLAFDQQRAESDQARNAVSQRIRVQDAARKMADSGVQMTPEMHGQLAKFEERRTHLNTMTKQSSDHLAALQAKFIDSLTDEGRGDEFDPGDTEGIVAEIAATQQVYNSNAKLLVELEKQAGEFRSEAIQQAQEYLESGAAGQKQAAEAPGAFGGGAGGGQAAEAPTELYSPTLDKTVSVEMVEQYAKKNNIPITEVYQRLGLPQQ